MEEGGEEQVGGIWGGGATATRNRGRRGGAAVKNDEGMEDGGEEQVRGLEVRSSHERQRMKVRAAVRDRMEE